MTTRNFDRYFGELAQEMHSGYLAYHSIDVITQNPAIADVVRRLQTDNAGPAPVAIASFSRQDGSEVAYDVEHAFVNLTKLDSFRALHERLWLSGALLELGDMLDKHWRSLDKDGKKQLSLSPPHQFLRHLRNAVAHGKQISLQRR